MQQTVQPPRRSLDARPEPFESIAPDDDAGDDAISPARLAAFSDGIIAIAATLLILDVRTPSPTQPVWSSLRDEWPALAAYASTFLVIGVAWIHHHNLFHQVRAVDRGLLFLNIGMLLTIAFLPLPTATLGDHLGGSDAVAAAIFYGLSMALTSGWFAVIWAYLAHHTQLLVPSARESAAGRWRASLLGPGSYLIAAAAAFVNPYLTVLVSGLVVAYFVVAPMAPAAKTRIGEV